MSPPTVIATVRSYDDLRRAVADWCKLIGMSRAELDTQAGLAEGHAGKLLTERAIKKFGNVSLGRVLAATGTTLLLVIDDEAVALTEKHIAEQANTSDHTSEKAPHWRLSKGPAWARRMNARRALSLSPARRREIARKAAAARWSNRTAVPPSAPIENSGE